MFLIYYTYCVLLQRIVHSFTIYDTFFFFTPWSLPYLYYHNWFHRSRVTFRIPPFTSSWFVYGPVTRKLCLPSRFRCRTPSYSRPTRPPFSFYHYFLIVFRFPLVHSMTLIDTLSCKRTKTASVHLHPRVFFCCSFPLWLPPVLLPTTETSHFEHFLLRIFIQWIIYKNSLLISSCLYLYTIIKFTT